MTCKNLIDDNATIMTKIEKHSHNGGSMKYSNIVMGVVAVVLIVFAYLKYPEKLILEAKNLSITMLTLLPIVIVGLIIASILADLAMKGFIKNKLQSDSIIIKMFVFIIGGLLVHGEALVGLPTILGIKEAGAKEDDLIVFITSWKLLPVSRLPEMIAFIDPIITIVYLANSLVAVLIASIILHIKSKILVMKGMI